MLKLKYPYDPRNLLSIVEGEEHELHVQIRESMGKMLIEFLQAYNY